MPADSGTQPHHLVSPPLHHRDKAEPESDDGNGLHSGDDIDPDDDQYEAESARAGGKRKRPLSVSCELCKQRKVKCDRGQPSCGWCKRNSVYCEYRERKKPGLRAGYGRELEQRLDKLEEILRSHSEILQNSYLHHPHPPAPPSAPSVRNSNASVPSDHGTPRDPAPMFRQNETLRTPQAETALFLQKPSTYPAVTQSVDFGMPPQTPSMHSAHDGFQPRCIYPAYHPLINHSLQSPGLSVAQSQTHLSSDQDLPPYDLLYALADLYFKHINTWCPILHRKTTLDALFGPSALDETDRILLHAIVATTLRYSTDARLTDERRQHYHDVSKNRVLLYGLEHSSVKVLQALVIFALDLCGSGNGPPGWNIMALITRSVVQLGLAVESNSFSVSPSFSSIYTLRAMLLPEPRDFVEDESRRRLFWMIYLLDRYATIATAFEFALDDKEIDRTLPLSRRPMDEEPESGHAMVPDAGLPIRPAGPRYQPAGEPGGVLFLKQPVDISALSDVEQWQMRYKQLDNLLTSWKFGLPGDFGNMAKLYQPNCSKTLNCAWVMLHATYHTAVIRLHSSAAYPTTRSPIFTPSLIASQHCHGAVENIAALGEFVVQNGLLNKLGPPFAFTLWVAARLLLVHGSTVEHKLSPQIAFLVDTLRDMGRYWPVAARYCELLQRVLDEHADSERALGTTGERITPSSVKILADMRRTAFDLDILISRQPRHPAGGGGGGAPSRLPSVTPARTPAPNELEYLDVFDFFNVPRLPFSSEATPANGGSPERIYNFVPSLVLGFVLDVSELPQALQRLARIRPGRIALIELAPQIRPRHALHGSQPLRIRVRRADGVPAVDTPKTVQPALQGQEILGTRRQSVRIHVKLRPPRRQVHARVTIARDDERGRAEFAPAPAISTPALIRSSRPPNVLASEPEGETGVGVDDPKEQVGDGGAERVSDDPDPLPIQAPRTKTGHRVLDLVETVEDGPQVPGACLPVVLVPLLRCDFGRVVELGAQKRRLDHGEAAAREEVGKGAYPSWDERKLLGPRPWASRMMGKAGSSVAEAGEGVHGMETRICKDAGRLGISSRTIGL
ncbi:transcriptional regulatory protein [Apiospora hydei]|uniref:Transcriptional regulatory protein n=1 Tax=Apiospora hydei TaxID=1337664 RepID=A0ABR1X959_9PEZI